MDIDVKLDFMENPCERCNGQGVFHSIGKKSECLSCQGTGVAIADEGRKMIEFLRTLYGIEPKVLPKTKYAIELAEGA